MLTIGIRTSYPVLLPHLRVAFGLDIAAAGLLLTVVFVAYALGQLPGGVIADRIGEGTIMVVSLVFSAATIGLIVLAESAFLLFAATGLFGLATGLFGVARWTAIADLYPEHVGTANGVVNAAMDAGQALFPPIIGILTVALAWQYGLGIAIPLFALVAIGVWLAVPARTSPPISTGASTSLETVASVLSQLRRPKIVHGTATTVLSYSVWMTFTGFYPTYLIEVKGLSATVASVIFGGFFALGVLIKPVVGAAYDRIGIRTSFLVVVSVFGLALLLLPLVDSVWLIAAVTIPVSAVLGWNTVMETYLSVSFPDDVQNTGFGILRSVYFSLGAVSPTLFGVVAGWGLFEEAFVGMAGLAGAMMLLALWLPDA